MIGNAVIATFVNSRRRQPVPGPSCIPPGFFESFGPDTALVGKTATGEYLVTTWADLGRAKKLRQEKLLRRTRDDLYTIQRRPIYVWVFHCPGLGLAYRGWWTYLVGRGWDSGKYLSRDTNTVRTLMDLFPCGDRTLFGPALTHEQWQVRFARTYCCRNPDGTPRRHAGRIQGKALLWAEFHGGQLSRILGRACLPARGRSDDGPRQTS